MLESKDPRIKLFGRQIPLSTAEASADDLPLSSEVDYAEEQGEQEDDDNGEETEKDHHPSIELSVVIMQQDDEPGSNRQEPMKPETFPNSENPKTPSINEEMAKPRALCAQKEQSGKPNSEEKQKGLKKPDKILPCPRCSSMDTKFCYYNNYNVNQPRHFCKSCQRYWTAGGMMRNVPVGAGRRKSKSSTSHCYRHITISEALQAARVDAPNGTHGIPSSKGNGTILSFSVDAPVCDATAYLHEKKVLNGTQNGFNNFEERNQDGCSSGSSITVPCSMDGGNKPVSNLNGFVPQVPCLPWPYIPPVPGIFPPGFGIPCYAPVDFWSCTNLHGAWNVPWMFPQEEKVQCSSSNSPTLGKRSREEQELPKEKNGCVLVPKTLRVNDPTEAAKSTIWATLGIKNDSISSKAGLFKAFQTKGNDKSQVLQASPVLCANPAALSRSIQFHESS